MSDGEYLSDTRQWDVTPDFNAAGAPGAEADTDLSFDDAVTASQSTTLTITCEAVGGSAAAGFSSAPLSSSFMQASATAVASDPDLSAEQLAQTAQAAVTTYGADQGGSYVDLTLADLKAINPTIQTVQGERQAWVTTVFGSSTGYTVTATSPTGDTYSISKIGDGSIVQTCTPTSGINYECDNGAW